ncbi:MAG: DNA polymerase III subunit delta [Candidatus Tectimicrobiota bacterium]|nr:MAG: DNA polymerase III subunit delta [Candidatus Tectomicrobia bacterium]
MPLLAEAEFLSRLDKGELEALYLLWGEEVYLVRTYLALLVDRALAPALRDLNYHVFDAGEEALAEALGVAQTLPMLAPRRVVVVHHVHRLRHAEVALLEQYAAQPVASTVLIATATGNQVEKTLPRFWQQAAVVACHRLEGPRLQAWIRRQVRQHGCQIAAAAVEALVQAHENDLYTLAGEIAKLCTYAGEGATITLEDVQRLSPTTRLYSLFALSDALGTGDLGQALAVVDGLLRQGEPPLVILSMIVRQVRLLWAVKHLAAQRQDLTQIAKTLNLPRAVCRQLLGQSRRYSSARLRRLYTAAVEADMAFKTSAQPARAILEGLIFRCCLGD